ncbi:ABC transporter ATP-binding protein [Caballeronia sp. LZ035]|uniref:ABC transporter ATP-binding protein n=1 Tax=Caballeronia sp. LZ035 TaxID=3038568 RepID=UPI002855B67B|nr:ABC transporter ATP-binding protein [Caballeronia sp. LZ035]MDR5761431.1 ABC transporter ATP-binding protein [Caballeronia sp. LZ035]
MLEVDDLHAGYGRVPVLNGLRFGMVAGEFVGVFGRNGMGKTTLMRALIGALRTTRGLVRFEGGDLTNRRAHIHARAGIGYVPQGRQIFPTLSVIDNLRMGCVKAPREAEATVMSVLELFPRLRGLLERTGGSLSGGEQQLVALARCLCGKPRLMLLDEPTEGIQPSICDEIMETLAQLRERHGIAILLVEQDIDFLRALSDRILVIERGEIIAEFPSGSMSTEDIAHRYGGLGAANLK